MKRRRWRRYQKFHWERVNELSREREFILNLHLRSSIPKPKDEVFDWEEQFIQLLIGYHSDCLLKHGESKFELDSERVLEGRLFKLGD